MRDGWIRRLVAAHLLSCLGEWAVTLGLLVHAYRWGGSAAVGIFSLTVLVAPMVCTPVVGRALASLRPHTVRVGGLAVQAVAYAGAAGVAALDAPTPAVAPLAVLGLAGTAAIHPTGAALLPRIARSTDDLISGQVWVGHCDSASAVLGSLTAGLLDAAGGPTAVFAATAGAATVGALATVWRPAPLALAARSPHLRDRRRVIRSALVELRARPATRGVLAISCARNLIVGAFDVLLVVVALDVLGTGDGGPGFLSALVGAGALCSTVLVGAAVRRSRLRGALMLAVGVAAMGAVALGIRTDTAIVFVVLPVMGVCMAAMDALSRTLLQRSSDPRRLGSMFAALGFVAGAGQVAGSLAAQATLAIGGPRVALAALGALLALLAAASVRSLRRADADAELPALEMSLLAGMPLFSLLPGAELEQVARVAERVDVAPGDAVAIEGIAGEDCVVIADGEFDVSRHGDRLGSLARGDAVGELALLTSIPRSATVTATSPGSVLRIGREPFLVAITGYDAGSAAASAAVPDMSTARERFRDVVAAHEHDPELGAAGRAETWLGLGAAGRYLGDPSFRDALVRSASLADADDERLVAHAAAITAWPGSFYFVAENPDVEMIELCENVLARLDADDPLRPRVLATLAAHATFAYDVDRRAGLIREALALAELQDDPGLLGAVLNAEFICLWEPATMERRAEVAASLAEIGARIGDAELAFIGRFFEAYCTAERGELDEARRLLAGLDDAILATRHEYFEFLRDRLLLSIDIVQCRPGVQDRIDALAARHAGTYADTDGTWAIQVGALAYQAGELGGMTSTIAAMVEGPHSRTWRAALALANLRAGDREAARRTLAELGEVPKNYFWITVAQVQAEVAAELGLVEQCRVLFDELSPFRERVGITASGSLCFGLVSRSLGELALALGRHEEAVALLAEAVAAADDRTMPFEAVVAGRLLARAHLAAGDPTTALTSAEAARAIARKYGFRGEADLLDRLAPQLPSNGRPVEVDGQTA